MCVHMCICVLVYVYVYVCVHACVYTRVCVFGGGAERPKQPEHLISELLKAMLSIPLEGFLATKSPQGHLQEESDGAGALGERHLERAIWW